jgi:hypothetical protein
MSKITHNGNELEYTIHLYANGGTAIQLWQDHEPYTMATVWVPDLKEGEIAIKDYSENIGIYDALLNANLIEPAHRIVFSGFVEIPVCIFKGGTDA